MRLAMVYRRNPSPVTRNSSLATCNSINQSFLYADSLPAFGRELRTLSGQKVGSWQNAVGNGLPSQPVTPPLTAYRSLLTVFRLQVGSRQKVVGNGLPSQPVTRLLLLTAHRLPSSSWQLAKCGWQWFAVVTRHSSFTAHRSPLTAYRSPLTAPPLLSKP